jgi:AraC-like DNA-binding protein
VNYQGLLLDDEDAADARQCQHFRPRYASLTFAVGRSDIQQLQHRLGCKVNAKSETNAIAFPVEILDYPIATSNRMLFSLLESYLAQMRAQSRSSLVEQIKDYVRRALPTRDCSIDGCAEKLGTSARAMQKRLTRMGVKFTSILQSERVELAKHALLWSERTLDEVAFQLGYSEQTSFGRAFKRSTGVTPQAYRATEERKH